MRRFMWIDKANIDNNSSSFVPPLKVPPSPTSNPFTDFNSSPSSWSLPLLSVVKSFSFSYFFLSPLIHCHLFLSFSISTTLLSLFSSALFFRAPFSYTFLSSAHFYFTYSSLLTTITSRLLFYSRSTFNLEPPLYTTINCTVLFSVFSTVS